MTNLFPLPYWTPALKRVPIPLQILDAAYAHGEARSSYLPAFPKTGTIASRYWTYRSIFRLIGS
jgi:hypothetical protein